MSDKKKPTSRTALAAVLAGAVLVVTAAAFGVPLTDQVAADSALSPAASAIPPVYLAAYQSAANQARPAIPWEILAAVGKTATEHGRRSPYDNVDRSVSPATTSPDTDPPIVGAGAGPLLLSSEAPTPPGADLQSITTSADVLADAMGPIEEAAWQRLGLSSSVVGDPLDDPDAERFWAAVLPGLPVAAGVGNPGPAAAPSGAATPAAPSPAGTPSTAPLARFVSDLLTNLGDSPTPAAIAGVCAWASGEGSTAAFNPLDTTLPEPGATAYNANGGDPVRSYPNYATGLAATVTTLQAGGHPGGPYVGVLTALRAGSSAAAIDAAVAGSPWGTREFPSSSCAATANFPGLPASVPAGPALLVSSSAPLAPVDTSTAAAVPTGTLAQALVYAGDDPEADPAPAQAAPPASAAAVAVAVALAQLGKPYQLGATGPATFDCSGLVQYAYAAAGIHLPRTTYTQVAAGTAVTDWSSPGSLQPGDLLFIMGADPEGGRPGHVGMVIAPGQVIDAPYTGAVVRVTALSTWTSALVDVRRIVGGDQP